MAMTPEDQQTRTETGAAPPARAGRDRAAPAPRSA